jgi:hypothetical protein
MCVPCVVQVKATGGGTYAIYSGDPQQLFTIDRVSGVISVLHDLDADRCRSLMLNIQAAVGNPPAYNHTQAWAHTHLGS